MAHRMIPMLWFRILVLVGFLAYTAYSGMWVLAAIGVVLLVLSGFQLRSARNTRDRVRAEATAPSGARAKNPEKRKKI
ncbi:CD36 family protein [Corynebacterium pygosceleis]|uniref:CD36 family protein n=1 Tax=Corynebacterium pygosceleis TaxID=2800406 RepID=UPI0020066558|nr:CD36 family protein [Corynebacterium pygosceleis]MCK7674559.1 CD36 family protein [Corynebacterium pygosceleis]